MECQDGGNSAHRACEWTQTLLRILPQREAHSSWTWEQSDAPRLDDLPNTARPVCSCHISPCSTMILTASGCDLHLWDAASGILKSTFKGHTNTINGCRFFPDGKTVVSTSSVHTLKVWDVKQQGSLVMTLVGHADNIRCVDVPPDNTRILSGSFDGT